jgi:aminoglycoside 2'-N-acetyltransferase I
MSEQLDRSKSHVEVPQSAEMEHELDVRVIAATALQGATKSAIIELCNRAYETDVEPLYQTFKGASHVLGYLGGTLVSHAMWVTRWLVVGQEPPLHTAYVELVATEPVCQGRGFASAVMRRLAEATSDFELGALCPAEEGLYARLGWVFWRGPLFIRKNGVLWPTPDERVMILPLPRTPPLDLDSPLSAEWRPGELW